MTQFTGGLHIKEHSSEVALLEEPAMHQQIPRLRSGFSWESGLLPASLPLAPGLCFPQHKGEKQG